jgi:hypothetical protein
MPIPMSILEHEDVLDKCLPGEVTASLLRSNILMFALGPIARPRCESPQPQPRPPTPFLERRPKVPARQVTTPTPDSFPVPPSHQPPRPSTSQGFSSATHTRVRAGSSASSTSRPRPERPTIATNARALRPAIKDTARSPTARSPDATSPRSAIGVSSPTSILSPTADSSANALTIKAAHKSAIVMLRVARDVTLQEVRKRLYEKLVGQEGVPLRDERTFAIAYVLPPTLVQPDEVDPSRARPRSNRTRTADSEAGSVCGGDLDEEDLRGVRIVTSQVEWEMVVVSAGRGKVNLRVIDVI